MEKNPPENPCKDVFEQKSNERATSLVYALYKMERRDILDFIHNEIDELIPKSEIQEQRLTSKLASQEAVPESSTSTRYQPPLQSVIPKSEKWQQLNKILEGMKSLGFNKISKLPSHIIRKIEESLNEEKDDRRDWRGMAGCLGLELSFIHNMEKSPRENPCMEVFEQKSNERANSLVSSLYRMERRDILDFIHNEIYELTHKREKHQQMAVHVKNIAVDNLSEEVKVRILAQRFVKANPSCIAVVPHYSNSTEGRDSCAINVCLYMHTNGLGITDDLREEAQKKLGCYNLKFIDLEREPLGEYFTPRTGDDQRKTDEMAKLSQSIEKTFSIFENRLNVTAVYPSYKISKGQETNQLCVTVAVLGKGKIPVGEKDFREVEVVDDYPFDIVEGYFVPTHLPSLSGVSPLEPGVGIGVRGKCGVGTLGAVLMDGENYYALSCNHVLCKQDGQPGEEKSAKQPQSPEEKPSIESPGKNDFNRGKARLEEYINAKKEYLAKLENGGDPNEVRKIESQIRAPAQYENLIEQPAADDFIAETDDLIEKISRNEERLKEETNTYEIGKINSELASLKAKLEYLRNYGLPRCIARYSCGLRENYNESQCERKFFVDAGIARISDDERDGIQSKSSSEYTFLKKSINGEVVAYNQMEKESDNAKFWKCGRTTGLTEGAKFCSFAFFNDRVGFGKNKCVGNFTHNQFDTYCQTCATKINFDLFETSLSMEGKCKTCRETILESQKRKELWAYNCFLLTIARKQFSDEGDSGAVVFDEEGRAWGIIVGCFYRGNSVFTVVSCLDIAIKALSEKFGRKLKLWCGEPN